MRSKLTKTIILIVFVVFLGINNVEADSTCTYARYVSSSGDDSGTSYRQLLNSFTGYMDGYTIEMDSRGNVTSITHTTMEIPWIWLTTTETVTSRYTVNFTLCPSGIAFDGNTIVSGSVYALSSGDISEWNNESSYVGTLSPGEDLNTVSCGEISDIPKGIPNTTKIIYLLLQMGIPIALVIFGMIDLMKSISAQKEDEIKKGQQTFIKRLISAAIVFFVFAIVKAVVSFLADNTSVGECLNCFIKGECTSAETGTSSSGGGGGGNPNYTAAPY